MDIFKQRSQWSTFFKIKLALGYTDFNLKSKKDKTSSKRSVQEAINIVQEKIMAFFSMLVVVGVERAEGFGVYFQIKLIVLVD